jgi:hypothetical protein
VHSQVLSHRTAESWRLKQPSGSRIQAPLRPPLLKLVYCTCISALHITVRDLHFRSRTSGLNQIQTNTGMRSGQSDQPRELSSQVSQVSTNADAKSFASYSARDHAVSMVSASVFNASCSFCLSFRSLTSILVLTQRSQRLCA